MPIYYVIVSIMQHFLTDRLMYSFQPHLSTFVPHVIRMYMLRMSFLSSALVLAHVKCCLRNSAESKASGRDFY